MSNRWIRRGLIAAALLVLVSGGWLLACPPAGKKPEPILNNACTPPCVMLVQGLEGVGFSDEKALRRRVAELLDEKTLAFWQKACRQQKAKLLVSVTHAWSYRTRCEHISISSSILVRVPPATCEKLLGLDEKQRLEIIRKPGAITIERLPGRF